jgi:dTDP-3-amino-3,4,6-trideoxy-alpha-D-glucose transaminase
VELPQVAGGAEPVWHLFVVRTGDRDGVLRRLRLEGVEARVHYPTAVHETGAYAGVAIDADTAAEASRLAASVLSLPIGPHLSNADADRVITAVRRASAGVASASPTDIHRV